VHFSRNGVFILGKESFILAPRGFGRDLVPLKRGVFSSNSEKRFMYFSEERLVLLGKKVLRTSRKRAFYKILGKSVLRTFGKDIALLGKGCFKNNPEKCQTKT
jgi:hypothetical protein